jgi:hypothetical protein
MATIVTRSGKGSPLTNNEVDANFTNLNTELGTKANTSSLATVATTGAYADLTGKPTIASADGSVVVTGTTNIDLSVAVAGSTSNVVLPIRNTTGATLAKGTAVYISGATGQISTVSKAIATGDATSAQTLGLVTANIANNSNGNVTLIGTITNIDTSAYTDGQQLYLSPTTAGTLTATKPYAPQHLVYVAVVEHAHPSQGKLFVKVQNGYEMDELHDVSAQNPANNDGLFYNTSTSLWEKKSIATALGFTPYNATNPAGYITGITSGNVTTALGYTPANRAGDTFTGIVNFSGGTFINGNGDIHARRDSGTTGVYYFADGGTKYLYWDGGQYVFGSAGSVASPIDFRAPTFYDGNNTAYYMDLSGSTSINAGGSILASGNLTLNNGANRYVRIGSATNYSYDLQTTGDDFQIIEAGTTPRLTIKYPNGNLGLGNVNPQSRFTIGSAQGNSLEFTYSSDNAYRNIIANYWNSGADTRMDFNIGRTGNVAPVTVMSVGYNSNVGVGTTEPAGRLHSVSTSAFTAPNLLCTDTVSNFRIVFNTGAYAGVPANKPWLHSYDDIYIGSDANVTTRFMSGGATNLAVASTGIVTAATAFNAPVFTDSLNSAYYVDPNGNSNISQLMTTGAVVIGGVFANNSYGTAGARLLFGGGNEPDTYFIGTNIENYGGNYSKLDLRWHTGIRIGAQPSYGGVRFYDTEALGTQIFAIGKDGSYAQANQSMRAPVFYDLDNTTYYIDPASGSNLIGQVQINGGTTMSGGWNRALYLASQFPVIVMNSGSVKYSGIGVDYSEAQSGMVFWVNGNSADITNGSATAALRINTGNYVVANDFRAAIFYDTNNSGYFLDPAGSSNLVSVQINGTLDVRDSNAQFWRSTNGAYQRVDTRTEATSLSRAHWYGVSSAGGTSNFRHAWYDNAAYFNVTAQDGEIIFERTAGETIVRSTGSFRAPIFYDSDNTGYYLDPNVGSSLNVATVNEIYTHGWFRNHNSSQGIYNQATGQHWYSDSGNYWNMGGGNLNGQGIRFRDNNGGTVRGYVYYDQSNNVGFLNNEGNWRARVVGGDYFLADGSSARAQLFYDSNDTAYYVDPNSTSRLSVANVNFLTLLNDEGLNVKGIRGQFAAGSDGQGISLFSNVDIGYPSGWGSGLGNTPSRGLSVYGGLRVAYSGGGFITSDTSVRSPIFYDSNDTAYYVDPTVSSNLNDLIVTRNVASPSNYYADLQLEVQATSGTAGIGLHRAGYSHCGIYHDSINQLKFNFNNGTVTLNHNAGSLIGTGNDETYIRLRDAVTSEDWNSYIDGAEASYRIVTNATGANRAGAYNYGVLLSMANAGQAKFQLYAPHNGTDGNGLWVRTGWDGDYDAWNEIAIQSRSFTNNVDLRAPIFYDSQNTAYFADPNGRSRLASMDYGDGGYYFAGGDWGYRHNTPYGWIQFGPANSGHAHIYTDRSNFYFNAQIQVLGGSQINQSDIRSAIFYDSNNTGYYLDAATASNVNEMVSYSYRGNGNVGGTGSASWHPSGIYSAGYNWLYGGISAGGGDITSVNAVYANAYYDSGNTGYYVDPASTSNISSLTVANRINGSISGDAQRLFNHTGANNDGLQYWNTTNNSTLNPNTNWHYALRMGHGDADTYYSATIAVDFFADNVWLRRKGGGADQPWKRFALYDNGYAAPLYASIYYDADNTAYYLDANSTGTSLNVAGSIIAAGNVTAYSDRRLKNNIQQMTSALDKVSQLLGVTFTRNDLADTTRRYGGLLAQDVEKVLPEAVHDIGGTLGVDYNATIGLLVEAIKELRDEVEMLRK